MKFRDFAMKLLKKSDNIETSDVGGIHISFNRGDLENNYWQQSFIEFSQDLVGYSIRYFPKRYINDYTILGIPHKTYFEGWYTYSNGNYDVYKAKDEDIVLCKNILKTLKIS